MTGRARAQKRSVIYQASSNKKMSGGLIPTSTFLMDSIYPRAKATAQTKQGSVGLTVRI